MGRSKNRSLMGVPVYPTARSETHFPTRPVPWFADRRCFAPLRDLSHVAPVTTYELWADLPTPLVPQHLRTPIGERTYSDDTVLRRIPPEEIEAAVALMLAQRGARSRTPSCTRTSTPRTSGRRHDSCACLADAILDRLVLRAYQLNLKGESMREKRRPLTQTNHRGS